MRSLNGGPKPTTVSGSTAHRPQANASDARQFSWLGNLSVPTLAFLAEATAECEIRNEREATALQAQRDVSLTSQDRIIVRDDAPPTNVSDAENERSDLGDLDDVSTSSEGDDEDDIGHYDEVELEGVITRLARYGPSIIVEKTVQKHQSMAALVSVTHLRSERFDHRFLVRSLSRTANSSSSIWRHDKIFRLSSR